MGHKTARYSEGALCGRTIAKEDGDQKRHSYREKARTYTRVTDQVMSDGPGDPCADFRPMGMRGVAERPQICTCAPMASWERKHKESGGCGGITVTGSCRAAGCECSCTPK
jgi:hypothetical protein